MPVELLGHRVPGPVRDLGVREDDARILVLGRVVGPYVPVPLRRAAGRGARALEPGMLVRRVVDDELRDDAETARMRLVEEPLKILDGAVLRVHRLVLGDVVAVVAERRWIERQQPQRVDVERLHVVELLNEAWKVTEAIAIAVAKRLHVQLVDDRVLVPERVVGAEGSCGSIGHRCGERHWGGSALQPENVSGLKIRVESHVVARAAPAVARAGEQILHDVRRVRIEPELG